MTLENDAIFRAPAHVRGSVPFYPDTGVDWIETILERLGQCWPNNASNSDAVRWQHVERRCPADPEYSGASSSDANDCSILEASSKAFLTRVETQKSNRVRVERTWCRRCPLTGMPPKNTKTDARDSALQRVPQRPAGSCGRSLDRRTW